MSFELERCFLYLRHNFSRMGGNIFLVGRTGYICMVDSKFTVLCDMQQTFPFRNPSKEKFSLVLVFSTTTKLPPALNHSTTTNSLNSYPKSDNLLTFTPTQCHLTSASPPPEEAAQAATSNATSHTLSPATKSSPTPQTTAYAIASANQTRTS